MRLASPIAQEEPCIPWIGILPESWKLNRLKWSIRNLRNGIWGEEPDGIYDIPCVRVADFDRQAFRVNLEQPTIRSITPSERKGRQLRRGDLLIEKSGGGALQPVGIVVMYDHDKPATCSNFIARIEVGREFDSRFLTYVHAHLYSSRVNVRSIKQTTGIQNLDAAAYLNEKIAYPENLGEQRAIAAFLDRETARIDALIEKKQRQIELLQEKWAAFVSHAITKGLNPQARLKASGIQWLGEIPEHWTMSRLGFHFSIGNGSTPARTKPDYWDEGTIPWLTSGKVHELFIEEADEFATKLALAECHLPIVPAESIVVAITGEGKTRGTCALLRIEATISQHLAYLKPKQNGKLTTRYVKIFLTAAYPVLRAESSGEGGTKAALTCEYLKGFRVPVPPPDEQAELVRRYFAASKRDAALIARVQDSIQLLREYRTTLISAAVTGKIDVREEVAA